MKMAKIFEQEKKAQELLANGVNKIANIVKLTLGPKGRNAVLDRKFSTPLITNDGVTIAREFEVEDVYENMGIKLIKEVCQKTNDLAGDGTTTAIVLAQKMLNEGLKYCNNGYSPILLNKGINKAKDFCISKLKLKSIPVSTAKEVENIATISSQNEVVGKLISSVYERLGKNGTITLQDSKTASTEIIFQEGMNIDKGYVSPHLCNNLEKSQTVFEDCLLLLTDKKLTNFAELLPILEQVVKESKPLLIICDDIDDETLSSIVLNKVRGAFSVCVVKAPFYGDKRVAVLEDIACLTNTIVYSDSTSFKLQDAKIKDLGTLKYVKVTKDSTTLVSKSSSKDRLNIRTKIIEEQIKNSTNEFDRDELKNRLSNLTGGIATIMVGANSDIEQSEKKLRIEDAIAATTSAIEQGIVAGGGVALLKIKKDLDKYIKTLKDEEKFGAMIVSSVLSEPIIQILKNAGLDESIIINKILKNKNKNFGFNALTNKYCDMILNGVIDPTKVTIVALSNATSVVTTMLTTSSIISDKE